MGQDVDLKIRSVIRNKKSFLTIGRGARAASPKVLLVLVTWAADVGVLVIVVHANLHVVLIVIHVAVGRQVPVVGEGGGGGGVQVRGALLLPAIPEYSVINSLIGGSVFVW